jgi:hypothetical protein
MRMAIWIPVEMIEFSIINCYSSLKKWQAFHKGGAVLLNSLKLLSDTSQILEK